MSYNPNQSNNNGGYHPRKSYYKNPQAPQFVYPQAPAAAGYPAEYLGAYQQAYQYYPNPQAQYYTTASAAPGAQYVPVSAPSPYSGPHPLKITDAKGDSVDLRQFNSPGYTPKSNAASLNRSSNPSTPKAPGATVSSASSSPYAHQRTSSISSAKNSSTAHDDSIEKLKESFRQQIQARAQKAKESKSTSTPVEATKKVEEKSATSSPASVPVSTSTSTPAPAPVAEKVKEESSKKESTPVKEETKVESKVDDAEEQRRKFRESIAAKTKKLEEEKKAASKASTPEPSTEVSTKAEESKDEAKKEESTSKTEEPVTAAPASAPAPEAEATKSTTEQEEPVEVKKEEQTEPVSETKSVSIEEPKVGEKESSSTSTQEQSETKPQDETSKTDGEAEETPKEPVDTFTISRYLETVNAASDIDPYTFEYSENLVKLTETDRPSESSEKKYRYHPGFLMQFADVVKFPVDEEFKEKIKFIQISEKGGNRSFSKGGQGGQFRSGFGQGSIGGGSGSGFAKSASSRGGKFDLNSRSNSRQNSKRKGGSGRNDRKSNRNRDREVEKEPEVPAEPVKPLEKSATRWIPKSRLKKAEDVKLAPDGKTVILDQDEVNRKVKSFLNKLTLEYFEEISNDIINIANQSQWETNAETLKLVLELTFAKACDEPHWSSMYAQFCAKMCKDVKDEVKDEEIKDKSGEPVTGGILVRKLLLTRCQTEYTKGWADKLPANEDGSPLEPDMMTDEYYQAAAAKRRGLGLIRFIGHLYVLGLLSDPIILTCIADQSKNTTDPSEDAVENLIQLIKTVGPRLDTHENATYKGRFAQCFQQVHEMIKNAKISSRLEFKLMDLVDLRRRRWQGGESDAGPKTIQQIHQEADLKKQEDEKNSRDRRNQSRGDSRQNSSKASWGSQRVSSNDIRNMGHVRNSNASSSGPTNNFTRAKSLRGSARQPSQNVNSENSSNSNSTAPVTASPLSARENSKKADTPAVNSFNALMNDESHKDDESDGEQHQEEETEKESEEPVSETVADSEEQQEPSNETTDEVESKEEESTN
ncbi:Eukaryotic initiation factor subunit [Wickerhamomyces ciferrii]|uniref:Eukaryotic initiation factor subunit n=1 Tax=Wickerhamomyces ciferrii (strain ATCC 14091 / BCRC 22168 / CBS 111 / JCM 3599 / NBRC 0793 / NRRL Y-1031 F-60-10) TaxID=1206466 RepID=K0KN73_WICCF|nr:Eukaryotic initiation factor subunit [Wickerhamomyces ciferrii]CCH46710.1 Eukaryotic initiation factor subunit [Wickerhamomyces ciferrii]